MDLACNGRITCCVALALIYCGFARIWFCVVSSELIPSADTRSALSVLCDAITGDPHVRDIGVIRKEYETSDYQDHASEPQKTSPRIRHERTDYPVGMPRTIRKCPVKSARGPCPECHHPGKNRDVRMSVKVLGDRERKVCYYCASGWESIPEAVITRLPGK